MNPALFASWIIKISVWPDVTNSKKTWPRPKTWLKRWDKTRGNSSKFLSMTFWQRIDLDYLVWIKYCYSNVKFTRQIANNGNLWSITRIYIYTKRGAINFHNQSINQSKPTYTLAYIWKDFLDCFAERDACKSFAISICLFFCNQYWGTMTAQWHSDIFCNDWSYGESPHKKFQ